MRGAWFSPRFSGEKVPTLAEALRETYAGGMEPLIERKSGSARAYHRTFDELGLDPDSFRVMSFNRRFIRRLDQINPDYNLGILGFGPITQPKINRLSRRGADFISWNHRRVRSQATVDRVHARGLELYVWTVNDGPSMRRLSQLGVDGITTDDPAMLRRWRQRPGSTQNAAPRRRRQRRR